MYRCAILNDYQNAALAMADWSPVASEVEVTPFSEHIADRKKLAEALKDFDIICLIRERTPVDAALLEALPKLKLLITAGARNNSVDEKAVAARGITYCHTGGSAGATAELAWAFILGLARSLPAEDRDFKAGAKWQPRVSHDVTGKRLGVIGFGRLGGRVAKVGVAFDMEVAAYTPKLTDDRLKGTGVRRAASLDDLLKTSDFVSIHVGLNPSTRGMIGARELGLMKPTAFLINTSRGPIVEEKALIEALRNRRIAGAGLDVFDQEPLPADHPLRRLDNLIATPHIGFVTEASYSIFFRDMVEDIAAWLKGTPVRIVAART